MRSCCSVKLPLSSDLMVPANQQRGLILFKSHVSLSVGCPSAERLNLRPYLQSNQKQHQRQEGQRELQRLLAFS